jgi:hypothetical protein
MSRTNGLQKPRCCKAEGCGNEKILKKCNFNWPCDLRLLAREDQVLGKHNRRKQNGRSAP